MMMNTTMPKNTLNFVRYDKDYKHIGVIKND